MRYRRFGRLDWQVSALGFGAMRLPVIDGDSAKIDEPEATRIMRHAIDNGVNYVDTAYGYHRGNSELFVGRALRDGYREKVKLATKLPCWLVEKADDFDRLLDEQRGKLQTEAIDFYLLHGLDAEGWHKMRDLGVIAWAERTMVEHRIHHLGFSFHDSYEVFREIIDAYDSWTFCQIQYNYMDVDQQAGRRGLEYAADRGLAVVVMEPLRGGLLAENVPPSVQALWDSAPVKRTAADWALQWLWDQPAVSLALSGMSTMQQVEENLASADRAAGGTLTDAELDLVAMARDEYQRLCAIPCTDCKYCQPCPNNVAIPRIFEIYNEAMMYNSTDRARHAYAHWVREEERANCCLECGECEPKCPQGIAIIDWLKTADQFLTASGN